MKEGIHPKYVESVIKCACGNEIRTKSVKKEISVEICSRCHPFFTGKQKLVDSAGRVEKFNQRYGKKKSASAEKTPDEQAQAGAGD